MNWGVGIWHLFKDSHPEYLVRHYWWAYLWRVGGWFFDHQMIINAILFGQYRILTDSTVRASTFNQQKGQTLQLTCNYGDLTNRLLNELNTNLHLMDVSDLQLSLALNKNKKGIHSHIIPVRMNAERLAYRDNAFSTVVLFFLLHEIPNDARQRCIEEIMRVLKPDGRLVITDYGVKPEQLLTWQFRPVCRLIFFLEPFLEEFMHEDLTTVLTECARQQGKQIALMKESHYFKNFYRVCVYKLGQHDRSDEPVNTLDTVSI